MAAVRHTPPTARQARRRYLIVVPLACAVMIGGWIVLNELMPLGCPIAAALLSDSTDSTECQEATVGYLLHFVAAALTAQLVTFGVRWVLRRVESDENCRAHG